MNDANSLKTDDKKEKTFDKFINDSTFIVFLLPLCAFFITYCIEIGYTKYFGIPMFLIRITGIKICFNFIILLLFFCGAYSIEFLLSKIFSRFFKKTNNKDFISFRFILYNFIELIIIFLIACLFFHGIKNMCTATCVVLLLLFIVAFIVNLRKKSKSNAQAEYVIQKDKFDEIDSTVNLRTIKKFLGNKTIVLLFITIILTVLSLDFGSYSAKIRNCFIR